MARVERRIIRGELWLTKGDVACAERLPADLPKVSSESPFPVGARGGKLGSKPIHCSPAAPSFREGVFEFIQGVVQRGSGGLGV